jgi:hypothetical protein
VWNLPALGMGITSCLLISCHQGGSTSVPTGEGHDGNGALVGLYVLRSLAGYPPPVVGNEAANLVVIGDTIRLNLDGTGVERGLELLLDATVPQGELKRSYERWFHYRLSESRIEVEFSCSADALMLCAAPPHYLGTVTPEGLEFGHALYYRTPLVFERVGD